jgi:predicted DsbA family dithiol-disulfide isomerase
MVDFMYVDVWSDVVCPFCYLGTHQLFQAINRFEHRAHVIVRRRAFELDPAAAINYDLPLAELLARKYSMPVERARAINERLEGEARDLGMTWSLDNARPTNTFDAHRVIALATTQGLAEEVSDRLYLAYFSEGELISDHSSLTRLAGDVGVTGVEALWTDDAFAIAVRDDESAAQELGITGVPAFLVDGKFMVVGAQGPDQILSTLQRAWARRADQSSDSAGTTAAVATE